jgi:hypothetical protein
VEWAWPLTLWTLKPTLSQLMEVVGSGVGVVEVPFVDILSFQILDVFGLCCNLEFGDSFACAMGSRFRSVRAVCLISVVDA